MFKKKTITAILSIAMAAASFTGCSSGNNKSSDNSDVKSTVSSPAASKSYTVFTLENSNKDIADPIITNSGKKNVKTAELNSLQSISKSDINSGASYISLMQKNYDVLADAMK